MLHEVENAGRRKRKLLLPNKSVTRWKFTHDSLGRRHFEGSREVNMKIERRVIISIKMNNIKEQQFTLVIVQFHQLLYFNCCRYIIIYIYIYIIPKRNGSLNPTNLLPR